MLIAQIKWPIFGLIALHAMEEKTRYNNAQIYNMEFIHALISLNVFKFNVFIVTNQNKVKMIILKLAFRIINY